MSLYFEPDREIVTAHTASTLGQHQYPLKVHSGTRITTVSKNCLGCRSTRSINSLEILQYLWYRRPHILYCYWRILSRPTMVYRECMASYCTECTRTTKQRSSVISRQARSMMVLYSFGCALTLLQAYTLVSIMLATLWAIIGLFFREPKEESLGGGGCVTNCSLVGLFL